MKKDRKRPTSASSTSSGGGDFTAGQRKHQSSDSNQEKKRKKMKNVLLLSFLSSIIIVFIAIYFSSSSLKSSLPSWFPLLSSTSPPSPVPTPSSPSPSLIASKKAPSTSSSHSEEFQAQKLQMELKETQKAMREQIDSFSYVMDLGIEEDLKRLRSIPDLFVKTVTRYIQLLQLLANERSPNGEETEGRTEERVGRRTDGRIGGRTEGRRGGKFYLVHECIRGIYRGLGHITKDVLASGKASVLRTDSLLRLRSSSSLSSSSSSSRISSSKQQGNQPSLLPAAGEWIFLLFDHMVSLVKASSNLPEDRGALFDLLGFEDIDGDNGGMTPLHLATHFRLGRVMETLLSLMVNPNGYSIKRRDWGKTGRGGEAKEVDWMTSLHIAASQDYIEGVKILMKHGGDPRMRDYYGRTAMDIARVQGFVDLIEHFSSLGLMESEVINAETTKGTSKVKPDEIRIEEGKDGKGKVESGWREGSGNLLPSSSDHKGGNRNSRYHRRNECRALRLDLDRLDDLFVGEAKVDKEEAQDKLLLGEWLDREVFSLGRPLIVRNGMKGWKVLEEWKRKELLERSGGKQMMVASIPYGQVFGKDHGRLRLEEYVTRYLDEYAKEARVKEPAYIFDSEVLGEAKGVNEGRFFFSKEQNKLPWFLGGHEGSKEKQPTLQLGEAKQGHLQFFLGPEGSGAPFHFHCPAVNALVYGRKRWLLYPPGHSFYSKDHPFDDFVRHLGLDHNSRSRSGEVEEGEEVEEEEGIFFDCEQGEGEIMFVPTMWTHAVLNLSENIGFATEFDLGDC